MTTPETRRPAELARAIRDSLRRWIHDFRSIHGSPYVVALEIDDGCLVLRPRANTEAHYRQAVREIDDPYERAQRRWSPRHWVPTDQGPEFGWLSGGLRVVAWQPAFEPYRAMMFESMLLGMQQAAARGVFGRRKARSCLLLTTSDAELAIDLQRRSAEQLNEPGAAAELLGYLEAATSR